MFSELGLNLLYVPVFPELPALPLQTKWQNIQQQIKEEALN